MNNKKIKRLFEAAGALPAPEPPFEFSRAVVAAIDRARFSPIRVSFVDQLGLLFPRIAFATLLIVTVCMAADVYLAPDDTPLTVAVEQVAADEWLIAGK